MISMQRYYYTDLHTYNLHENLRCTNCTKMGQLKHDISANLVCLIPQNPTMRMQFRELRPTKIDNESVGSRSRSEGRKGQEEVSPCQLSELNRMKPEQNGRHLADGIFKYIFLKEKFCILSLISLKFIAMGVMDDKTTLLHVMVWCPQTPGHDLN